MREYLTQWVKTHNSLPTRRGLFLTPNCDLADTPFVPNIQLAPFVIDGLVKPILLVAEPMLPDATEGPEQTRFYVAEEGGTLKRIVDGQLETVPFLQIADRITTEGSEQGILGLALYPQFAQQRFLLRDLLFCPK